MKKLLIMAVAACCLAACNKELGPEYKVAPVISSGSCSRGLDDVLAGEVVGGGAQGVHTGLQLLAFQFKSLEVTGGDQHGQALRQQVVAAITGLNRHHIAKATQVFHIGTKNDFHTGSP